MNAKKRKAEMQRSRIGTKLNGSFIAAAIFLSVAKLTLSAEETGPKVFKEFLEKPPIIKHIAWTVEDFERGEPPVHFEASWQPGSYYLKRTSHPKLLAGMDLPVKERLFAKSEDRYLYTDPTGAYRYWEDAGDYEKDRGNDPYYSVSVMATSWLRNVMNMGVRQAEIGTIRWQGSTFDWVYDSEESRDRQNVRGELVVDSSGFPSRLILTIGFRGGTFTQEVHYGYLKPLHELDFRTSDCLPRVISIRKVNNPSQLAQTITISDLEISATELSANHFKVENIINSRPETLFVYTNKHAYVVRDGVRSAILDSSGRSWEARGAAQWIWRGCILAIILITTIGVLVVYKSQKNKPQLQ